MNSLIKWNAMPADIVIELFNAEVTRTVFWSLNFAFDEYQRSMRMPPECLALLLTGFVAKASRSGDNPINFAIKETIDALLDGAKDTTEDRRLSYSSALCDAIAHSMYPRQVFELLKTKAEVASGQFVPSQHLLAAAAAIGDIDRVQLLLSEGPNEKPKIALFGDAMPNAARIGREDILKILMKNEANTSFDENARRNIAGTIAAACTSGHTSIVHLLLESYSKAKAMETFDPEPAIKAAANHGHVGLVQALLHRFNLPNNHNTIIQAAFAASSRGYPLVIETLLNYSLDVNVISHEGQNLLHHAARGGHAHLVQFLLEHGVSYYEGRWGDPLYLAAINGHKDVVQVLLDHGADINAKGRDSCVLAHAARNGEAPMIRFLVDHGVDVRAGDSGEIALESAAERGHEETVRLLVGMGVLVDGCSGRDSPVLRAMMYGQQGVVDTLLELGAKKVDPLETEYAYEFLDGEYPMRLKV